MEEFPLQPLEPFVLTEPSYRRIANVAMSKALGLLIFGFVSEANKIVSLLYHHNVFDFDMDDHVTKACIHFAWAQSNAWPPFMLHPDPSKPRFVRAIGAAGEFFGDDEEVLGEMEEQWRGARWDNALRNKYPNFDVEDLNAAISLVNIEKYTYDTSSHAPRRLGQAIEIALILNHENTAKDLLRGAVADFLVLKKEKSQRAVNIAVIGEGRRIWKILNTGFLAKEFTIENEDVSHYVDSLLSTLQQRFDNGPQRPFKDESIKELVDTLDKTWLEIIVLEHDQSALTNCEHVIPKSFTHQGLSKKQIAEFEKRLGEDLPADFKEFLSVTDGFYDGKLEDSCEMFLPSSHMLWEDEPVFGDAVSLIEVSLIEQSLTTRLDDLFEWPQLRRAIHTGRGMDDAGYQYLVEPRLVKEAIHEFDRKYESADEGTRKVLERVAIDHYGGLQEMRETQWLMVVTPSLAPAARHVYR